MMTRDELIAKLQSLPAETTFEPELVRANEATVLALQVHGADWRAVMGPDLDWKQRAEIAEAANEVLVKTLTALETRLNGMLEQR